MHILKAMEYTALWRSLKMSGEKQFKEIGGYIELEHYRGSILHDDGLFLNCGRNALRYLIRTRKIRKILMPYYMCDSVFEGCREERCEIEFYHVDRDFKPEGIEDGEDTWIYLMNYYGQLEDAFINSFCSTHPHVILDNVQAYYHTPEIKVDTIYSCRKFFGLADGGILLTDAEGDLSDLPGDMSHDRMTFLLGRFEMTGSDFYAAYTRNNDFVGQAPVMRMSALTENLLRSIDYEFVRKRRSDNYQVLRQHLEKYNLIHTKNVDGPFAYPLLVNGGSDIRKKMIQKKIYIPTLWPNVIEEMPAETSENFYASNLLPLPCDQRYDAEDMDYMAGLILDSLA